MSNLVMILFPLYSIAWSLRLRRQSARLRQQSLRGELSGTHFELPRSVILAQLGLLLVGVGSWMFHMTLLYPMQLLDELPMIYGSGVLIFANHDLILAVNEFEHGSPKALRPVAGLAIAVYCAFVTFIYLSVWSNPLFHEAAYGLMVFVLVAQSLVLINRLKSSKRIYLTSLSYYVLGFTFWNLDNNICNTLTSSRGELFNFDSLTFISFRFLTSIISKQQSMLTGNHENFGTNILCGDTHLSDVWSGKKVIFDQTTKRDMEWGS